MIVLTKSFLTGIAMSLAGFAASSAIAQDNADLKAPANNPLTAIKTLNF